METPVEQDHSLQEALSDLLKLAGMETNGPVTAQQVEQASQRLRALLAQTKNTASASSGTPNHGADSAVNGSSAQPGTGYTIHKDVLIAGQLGIILHQLRQALNKVGSEVAIAKDMDTAISQYQKADYSLVIIDLFMPTEREGMIVLDEIKKISVICKINTKILVLAPQSKDRKALRDLCKSKGATLFLEKMEGWHMTVLKYCQGELTDEQVEAY